MQQCTKCREIKTEEEFPRYKKTNGTYGRRGHCKICDKAYKKAHWQKNRGTYVETKRAQRAIDPEGAREYDRQYYSEHKETRKESQKAYASTNRGKEVSREISKRYRSTEQGRKKEAARNRLNKALKSGKVLKHTYCDICGKEGTEAHHEDYNKPLEVRWLCKECHENIHHLNEGHKSV